MSIDDLAKLLDSLQGMPIATLTFAFCIGIGYILRFIPKFPNDGIPMVVVLFGVVLYMLLVDPHPQGMMMRQWAARNAAVGFLIGVIAWGSHKLILSHLEDFVIGKFPSLGKLFGKPNDTPPPASPNG